MARRVGEERGIARRALQEGLDFVRDAGLELWAVLSLSTLAGAAVFFADHAAIDRELSHELRLGGWTALALLLAPKLGALYRFALGGEAIDELGPGGLQWKRREWRLLATAVALIAFAAIAVAPLFGAAFATFALLRPLGVVGLGPLGPLGVGFLITAPVFALGFAALALSLARLALVFPAEIAEREPRFARGWLVSRGHWRAVGLTALATVGATVALRLGMEALLDRLEAGAALESGALGGWPLPDAAGVGLLSAALANFLFAPFTVGAFASLYAQFAAAEPEAVARAAPKAWAPQVQAIAAAGVIADTVDETAGAPPPEEPAEPEAEPAPPPEPAGPPPRLRLVHSVELLDTPLAPAAATREAEPAETHAAPEPDTRAEPEPEAHPDSQEPPAA